MPRKRFTASCTAGILEEPPTISTLEICAAVSPESFSACCRGPMVESTRYRVISSNFARVRVISMCLGPEASMVRKGRFTVVVISPESSILAFSAASRTRCMATASPVRSMPVEARKWSAR